MTMHDLGILIPIIAFSIPVLIVLIVFYFSSKEKKYKYDALIEASKNIKDTEDVKGLLESFKKAKKSNIVRQRSNPTKSKGFAKKMQGKSLLKKGETKMDAFSNVVSQVANGQDILLGNSFQFFDNVKNQLIVIFNKFLFCVVCFYVSC